ncbi:hypothetical protein GGR92_004203 [Spirosoma lacussanchae]|uniref:alpha-L-rhamnosidase-related protein n=1 Tax=Spirosoma lacussanchae TaxID=1884249 RepID=UPI001108805D|nr:alpha-L-rhamnosidase C-terminal domain-containing protein [Spirosoma lacussanchae]
MTKLFVWGLFVLIVQTTALSQTPPTALRTDLLLHTDRVWQQGLLTNLTLMTAHSVRFAGQYALIRSERPSFSWVVPSGSQTAYQVQVSTTQTGSADVWDSGQVRSRQSVGIVLGGNPLGPSRVYYWRVKIWNEHNLESSYSTPRAFRTASRLAPYETPYYPLTRTVDQPRPQPATTDRRRLYDFGKATFGQVRLMATAATDQDSVLLHIGEVLTPDRHVDSRPRGTVRYRRIWLRLQKGTHEYAVQFLSDKRNTGPKAIHMPDYMGEVLPFRYVEVELPIPSISIDQLVRHTITYSFDENASAFTSSDSILNQIWDLCKHTIRATTFTGYYVDGDRERIPYEADALINQLSHYATDAEFTMAKRSLNYLVFHATWPTEWSLQNILVAWYDYLNSGDIRTAQALYPDLKAKLLLPLARADGLISTRTGLQNEAFRQSIHYDTFDGRSTIQDIVDWPQQGVLGLGKKEAGETDGFVFRDYNAVVNAFHYQALVHMAKLASELGKKEDAAFFLARTEQVKRAFRQTFVEPRSGLIRDGEGTDHSSLHANMMALAFGLVPENHQPAVLKHIRSRGMACSVYGSQFLMDALYNAGERAYALALLTATDERSWYNMIRTGSTMTTEAWDTRYKPNQDWNHAWGAAPANIIVRKLMGVEPLSPAYEQIQIKPQPDTLKQAELQLTTLRGLLALSFQNESDQFDLRLTLPGNCRAVVYLPRKSAKGEVWQDGKRIKAASAGNFWKIDDVPAGSYHWVVR